jgi:hypothetical protein
METPQLVQRILSQSDPDYAEVVAVLVCEVDNQIRAGESLIEIGRVMQMCIPSAVLMGRVLAVALRNIKPDNPQERSGNGSPN